MTTFCEYMDRALYGPTGYYSSGAAKSGRAGDYFTAPDVGPAFGKILAEIFKGWEKKMAVPEFTAIEVGAGEGKLAKDILGHHPFRYIAVERSPVRRSYLERLKAVEVRPDLKNLKGLAGVLVANELIDAFPVHRIQMRKGKLRELFVEGPGERTRFAWKEPSTPELAAYFKRLGISLPDGYETEVNLAMAGWLHDAAAALDKGIVVLIDYGRPAQEYYIPERTRGTLRAFSKHKVSADFLDPSAAMDLTADVDFTSLALDAKKAGFVPLAFMEMGTFLMQGVETLSPLPSPLSLRYLLHPEGMGAAFHVLVLGKNIDPKEWVFEHNRLGRLAL